MYNSTVISSFKSFPKERENSPHKPRRSERKKKLLSSNRFKWNKYRGWPFLGENSKLASNTRVECNMREPKVQDQEWRRRQVTWPQVGQMFFLLVVFCSSCSNIIDTFHQYITMVPTRIHSLLNPKWAYFIFNRTIWFLKPQCCYITE